MYVVDLYTCTIRAAGPDKTPGCHQEPLRISFVANMPWRHDLIKCLESASYQLQSDMTRALKEEDEIMSYKLAGEIAHHELCLQILKVDKVDNYKTDDYLNPRAIDYAGVNLGVMVWSELEVWQ